MHGERGLVVEFMVVAALVAFAGFGVVVLAALGHDDTQAASTLRAALNTGIGAVVALAYAARGVVSFGGSKRDDGGEK